MFDNWTILFYLFISLVEFLFLFAKQYGEYPDLFFLNVILTYQYELVWSYGSCSFFIIEYIFLPSSKYIDKNN